MAESFQQQKARYLAEMEAMRAARGTPEAAAPIPFPELKPLSVPQRPEPRPAEPQAAPPLVSDKSQREAQPDGNSANTASPSSRLQDGDPKPVLQDKEREDTGYGSLIVQTVTADGALPVAGAKVVISRMIDGQETLQGYDTTDISGRTRVFALPAPSAELSQVPGNLRPYASYIISVKADGFGDAKFRNVPIFSGIQSIQQVVLLPVPEFGSITGTPVVDETQSLNPENQPATYQKEGVEN